MGWRNALLLIGGIGVPIVLSIIWQSRILLEQKREPRRRDSGFVVDLRQLLVERPILLFFGFFMVSSGWLGPGSSLG